MFDMNVQMISTLFLVITLIWSLLTWGTGTLEDAPFPTCPDVMEKCAISCRPVRISSSHTGEYSTDNVFCINHSNSSAAVPPYRLQGCPNVFFNTAQNTSGVCSIPVEDNATDLLLLPNELEPALYSFKCLYSISPTHTVLSNAIVASDDVPYRDVQVYINHVLQGSQNSTNITLGVGDNVTIVVRAVGNISVINASNQDERFVCRTHFACNSETRKNIHNRHLLCSLQSAMLSDDGRTLVVILDGVEWNRFIITLNEQLPHPSMTSNDTSSGGNSIPIGAIVGIVVAVVAVVAVIVVSAVVFAIIYCRVRKKKPSQSLTALNDIYRSRKPDNCREKQLLTSFHSKLVSIIPVDSIKDELVSAGIITMDDIQEIDHMPRDKSKATFILKSVNNSLGAGATNNFDKLLNIMEGLHNDDVKAIVRDIRRALATVLSSSCCHCDQFSENIKHHGYTVERAPTDADSNDNTLRTSLDQGIPLVTCSCSECKLPKEIAQLLGSSSIPDSWNILQLRQNSNRSSLQYNKRIKVTYTDLPDDIPMGEVLDWLQTKVCRSSTNHVNGQGVVNAAYGTDESLHTDNENENTANGRVDILIEQ